MTNPNMVFVATRKEGHGARVGYFTSREEISEGWIVCDCPTRDITDVMESLQCSFKQALEVMNR